MIELTTRIQNAGTEVVEAKAGGGSATLSMARAASLFGIQLVQALSGKQGIIQNAYVDGGNPASPFFTQPLLLGKDGIDLVRIPNVRALEDLAHADRDPYAWI